MSATRPEGNEEAGEESAVVDPGARPADPEGPGDEQVDGPGGAADTATGDAPSGPEGDSDDEGGDEDRGDDEPQQIGFELADWGARERKMLDEQLGALRVPRAWEASTLVVGSAHADLVDDLIDEIEERVALDLAPGVETVTYEVGDWPEGLEDRFIEALIENRVPHQRGYREIAVGVDDEERVDALVEAVAAAWEDEQPTEAELGGPDAQSVLSELFVSSDRLLHDASDRAGTVRFDDAAGLLDEVGLPFGFAQSDWDELGARVQALRDLLGEPDTTDEQINEAAGALRNHLRPLV